MSFAQVCKTLEAKYPSGVSERYKRLDAFDRLLDGTLYDEIAIPFDRAFGDNKRYIPIKDRRPSVIYNLSRIVSDECAALTFGEAHAPHVRCWDESGEENLYAKTEALIDALTDAADLPGVFMNAVARGSVGSCALIVRAIDGGKPYVQLVKGKYAKPVLNPTDPTNLLGLEQQYPVSGFELEQRGYADVDADGKYWLRGSLDDKAETWYLPVEQSEYTKDAKRVQWVVDRQRSSEHHFGCVPAVWLRNTTTLDVIDGPATVAPVADIIVEIDYLLSQLGRGIRYNADPLLVIKHGELLDLGYADSPNGGMPVIKDPQNSLDLEAGSDAKLLEMIGNGLKIGQEHVRELRDYALEVIGGLRADPQKMTGIPQSGRALELLYQSLVWLVERIRLAYGNRGLVPVLRILLAGVRNGVIVVGEEDNRADANPDVPMRLAWPSWWKPRGADLAQAASAWQSLAGGSIKEPVEILPREYVTRLAAMDTGASDPNRIVKELAEQERLDDQKSRAQEPAQPSQAESQSVEHQPKPDETPPSASDEQQPPTKKSRRRAQRKDTT